jgi:uncharacterized protein YdaU (DUF1376 family)
VHRIWPSSSDVGADVTHRKLWFKFYPRDFKHDANVRRMTNEQVGMYLKLLMEAWDSEHPGSLPNDDRYLSHLLGIDVRSWRRKHRDTVLKCWVSMGDLIWNERLQKEWKASEDRGKRAKQAAEVRWKDDASRIAEPMPPGGNAQAMPSESKEIEKRESNTPVSRTRNANPSLADPTPPPIPVDWAQEEAAIAAITGRSRRWIGSRSRTRSTSSPRTGRPTQRSG